MDYPNHVGGTPFLCFSLPTIVSILKPAVLMTYTPILSTFVRRALKSVRFWTQIRIMLQSLLGLLPSPPGLYHGALMLCFLSCKQPLRLKGSLSLPSCVPMNARSPNFHLGGKSQCYMSNNYILVHGSWNWI